MKRILSIEDDPIISSVYSSKYKAAGFATSAAADGDDGLRQLKSFKPDFVHLDLQVPKLNGAEIIKHIRANLQRRYGRAPSSIAP
jgi:DNA-binding response OmpR family regulator